MNSALDRQLRMLRSSGIGVERKHAQVITPDIESLLNVIFFYNGKKNCLRGIQEDFNLRFTQLHRTNEPHRYVYTEFCSKNRHGGINDASEGKVVPIVVTGKRNCHVALLDMYFSKVPQSVIDKGGEFYLSPLPFTPTGSRDSFFDDGLSLKTLQGLLKKICQDSKMEGNFTNHSLRATGATVLFDAGVPGCVIQKRTCTLFWLLGGGPTVTSFLCST